MCLALFSIFMNWNRIMAHRETLILRGVTAGRDKVKKLSDVEHYRISDISKMLGISVSGLKLYEKRGILRPVRKQENGYRRYNFMDIACIVMNRFFMSLGFSMNESISLYNAYEPGDIVGRLEDQEKRLREEICRQEQVLEFLDNYKIEMAHAREDIGKCTITQHPALYLFKYHDEGTISLTREEQKEFSRWINHMPFVRITSTYPLESFRARKPHITVYLSITEEWARRTGFDPGPMSTYLPARRSVMTMAYESSETFTYDCLNHVYDFVAQNGLKLAGDPFCFCDLMLNNHERSGYLLNRYRRTWVIIEDEQESSERA